MVDSLPLLFGQTTPTAASPPVYLVGLGALALLAVAFVLPFVLGNFIAVNLRMKEYWWKIGLILCAIFASIVVIAPKPKYLGVGWPPKLAIDLNGGVILVYEVDFSQTSATVAGSKKGDSAEANFDMGALIQALTRRLNPAGTKEILIRPFGSNQVEIIIPEVDPLEIENIKRTISTAGILEFRIVANSHDHAREIDRAREQSQSPEARVARSRVIREESGKEVAKWATVARDTSKGKHIHGYKEHVWSDFIRNAATGEFIEIPPGVRDQLDQDKLGFEDYLKAQGINDIEVLMYAGDSYDVTGSDLGLVGPGHDEMMRPQVEFSTKSSDASRRMGLLTGTNVPSNGVFRRLGIMLDGSLLSSPRIQSTISDNGRITGNFSIEEVEFLVGILRAGSLPAVLKKEPVSTNQIASTLGTDTIIKGSWSIAISLGAIILFMLVYYRLSGVVACFALTVNILITIAMMILIQAPFSLPGLAGLVLTVGMAVDANVLIYERMREEFARGGALRMVIRNGFDRAFITIVDSNLTTIITAVVLYVIGTDQVRGFAVTLTLGILSSMFTAVFCSRVIFEIADRKRWISTLKMMRLFEQTNFDFMAWWKVFAGISVVLIVVGLVATGYRGMGMLDIDFLGGTSVQPVFKDKIATDVVRKQLDQYFADHLVDGKKVQFSLTSVAMTAGEGTGSEGRLFKIDTSIQTVQALQKELREIFKDEQGNSQLTSYEMSFDEPVAVEPEQRGTAAKAGPEKAGSDKLGPDKLGPAKSGLETPSGKEPASVENAKSEKADPAPKSEDSAPDKTTPNADEKSAPESKQESGGSESPAAPCSNESLGTDDPLEPAAGTQPTKPSDEPVKAGDEPVKAGDEPAKAGDEPAKPGDKPTKTGDEPSKPGDDPAKPGDEPAKPGDEPSKPGDEPAKPAASDPDQPVLGGAGAENRGPRARDYSEARLSFKENKINASTLRDRINDAANDLSLPPPELILTNPSGDESQTKAYETWTVRMNLAPADAKVILQAVQEKLTSTPVFLSSSEIGGAVAGDTQLRAIYALLASMVGIVLYIWFRFQRVVWGVAAVIALVHDVLMMLGGIAVSLWFEPMFGFLMVEEFKINLVVVAAFLTLVGFSINDTIVVFDRIREVRGKSPNITRQVINQSINQTLSRSVLTNLTVFIVVLILYCLGGQTIHGFAFSLVVGVIVGSYSSVFIAAPVLLWMSEPEEANRSEKPVDSKKAAV